MSARQAVLDALSDAAALHAAVEQWDAAYPYPEADGYSRALAAVAAHAAFLAVPGLR